MVQKLNQNPKYQIIFPEEASDMIQEILKRYDLEIIPKEGLEKIKELKNAGEKINIIENFPGRVLARAVKELAEEKIEEKELLSILEKKLAVSSGKAKKIAEDLKKEVLIYAKKVALEETVPTTERIETPSIPAPAEISSAPALQAVSPEEEIKEKPSAPKPKKKPDAYRESIE